MAAHRKAALLLHALSKPDRRWVLARLAQADQRMLDGHLSELKELGIPADPSLDPGLRPAARSLRGACAAQMHALLAGEPVWLLRCVLALEAWPWRHDYLAALTPQQRARLAAAVPAPLPARLADSVREHLAQALARQPALAAPAPTAPLPRIQQWLKQWR